MREGLISLGIGLVIGSVFATIYILVVELLGGVK